MTTALPPSVPQEKRLTKGERTRLQLLEVAAAEFAERLAEALATDAPLSADERRARGGLTNRQITLS